MWLLEKWLLKERGWPGNNRKKQASKEKAAAVPPEPAPTTEGESPKSSGLSTTQWLAVASIVVSLVGIYYKREELKAVFDKKTPVPAPKPARVEPEPARATHPKGLKKWFKLSPVVDKHEES